jgi:hypothetical protein
MPLHFRETIYAPGLSAGLIDVSESYFFSATKKDVWYRRLLGNRIGLPMEKLDYNARWDEEICAIRFDEISGFMGTVLS